jgi:hypothetical protein
MDVGEPRVRRRGFFFHVETPDLDAVEQDTAEGISVRLRVARPSRERLERSAATSGRKSVTSAIRSTTLVVQPVESHQKNGSRTSRASEQGESPRRGAIEKSALAKRRFAIARSASGTGSHRLARMPR